MGTKNLSVLGDLNQDSISLHQLELNQFQTIDKLKSFHFKKIEFKRECDPDTELCDSFPKFESMLTTVFLPDLDSISEPTLIPVPINLEIES